MHIYPFVHSLPAILKPSILSNIHFSDWMVYFECLVDWCASSPTIITSWLVAVWPIYYASIGNMQVIAPGFLHLPCVEGGMFSQFRGQVLIIMSALLGGEKGIAHSWHSWGWLALAHWSVSSPPQLKGIAAVGGGKVLCVYVCTHIQRWQWLTGIKCN